MRPTDYVVPLERISHVGDGLSRPECILAQQNGVLWISDDKSGVVKLSPDGTHERIGALGGAPNGVAMDRDGSFVVANIETGSLQRLNRDGSSETMLDRLDGQPLGAVNFALYDSKWRLWVSVSTRTIPRRKAIDEPRPDGYVMLIDGDRARIVADGFHFTNEVRLNLDESVLYVAETARGRVTAFDIGGDGALSNRRVHGPDGFWPGALIDGITVDATGALWITEITRNALIVLPQGGEPVVAVEGPDEGPTWFPTSVTFGGADLKDAYIGSLKMDRLARFRAPVAGPPPPHWLIG
ncbi:SMP-30/gluconolactonase/LRE family protein [Pikeienuella piscinae]|uniref:SMP-30/gluconolactonase/LRE family protein n=1 Tax=Pikeienuella piscinae TaxID=2748098 RepID=A0A7L5BUS6_9RHOB|nr:SMP-30/gluconolactonase/LRE family protein [Pikeienuella piscinae]QIE55051.1 SMP-30/gluconolactonase/LRE family protein [Pikeienuella piscinae]